MIYKLSRKTFGTKQIENFLEIETSKPIQDICYVNDYGLVFSTDRFLGLITPFKNIIFPWMGEEKELISDGTKPSFGLLSGMDYNPKHKILLVAENGGRNVRAIDLINNYTTSLIQKTNATYMESLLKKTNADAFAHLHCFSPNKFLILTPSLRKCFMFKDSIISHVAGDGKCRFTTGAGAKNSSIGLPSGMAVQNNKIYISDQVRNVIRAIEGDSISLACGHPHKDTLNSPTKIVIAKNAMYILCSDSIRTFITDSNIGGDKPTYQSDNIQSIAADEESGLYILEEQNA